MSRTIIAVNNNMYKVDQFNFHKSNNCCQRVSTTIRNYNVLGFTNIAMFKSIVKYLCISQLPR